MVKHDDGRFGIQLGDSGVELELCVLSQSRNFAPIGLLVDEVDLLLDTWFPGLASFEEDGYADVAEDDGESNADEGLVGGATSGLMRRLVPCPECLSSLMDGGYVSLSALSERVPDWRAKVHWLGYRLCAERALTGRPLRCPRCGAAPEPRSLVPELLFADVDRSAIVEAGRLRLRREPDCLLGEGAFGSVYRAWLGDTQVAAKISKFLENFVDQQQQQTDEPVKLRLQSGRRGSSSTRSLESAGATNEAPSAESAADSLVQLERARRLDQAIDGLKRMRHEANVLQALRSPFLVAFRGICLEPLCFLTELAPLGSLAEVREEARKQRPGTALPLGRQLSYKMAYEVITAVAYMHSLSVLYRDLKSDNVLVFSKDPAARLHVKLGDYGTSLNTGLQGTTGRQGTPGYMAPEVLRDCTYDEKVDVYSFGMVLYELICGERPFSKLPSSENLTKVVLDGGHPEFTVQEAEQAAFMGQLAQQCWRLSPGARPTAAGIRVAMETHSRWALERFIALPNDGAARTEAPVEAAAEERDGGGIPDFVGAMAEPTCACITELLESSILVLFLWKQLAVSAAVPGRQQSRQFAILDLDTGWWRQAPTFFAGPPVVSMRRARSVYCLLTWFDMAGGQPQLQICSYMNGQPEGFHMLREIPLACRPSPVETALSYDGDRDRLVVTGQQSLLLFTGFSDPQLIGLSASPVRQLHHEIRLLTEEHQVSAVAHCPQADWFAVRILQLERSGQRRRCSQLISVNKESLSILPVTDELPAEVECLIADSTGSRLFLSLRWSPIIREFDTAALRFSRYFTLAGPGPPVVSESLLCDAETAANCEAVAASSAISRRPPSPNAAFVSRLGLEPGTGLLLAGRSVGDVVALRTDGPEAGNVWTVADPDCGQAPAGFALGRVSRLLVSDSGGGVGGGGGVSSACVVVVSEVRRTSGGPLGPATMGFWSQWRFYGDSVKESFAVLFREG
ncbi:hypothetical protein BOX15_Mlig024703g2 [Macrostomum lignano]|uniref:Protein kinase domain-containing protein n=1 Tax=Macrostomum lignano TaxID=282301 RepID=A0A267FUU6_9PLAT|nr:hypothetical protein BOX15_Mlig024703g2 [Macrostomum lignano]